MSPLDVVILAKRPSPSAESPEACFELEFPDEFSPEAFWAVQAKTENKETQRPAKINRVVNIFFSNLRMGNLSIYGTKRQFGSEIEVKFRKFSASGQGSFFLLAYAIWRRTQAVREWSAKPLCISSILIGA